MCSWSLDNEVRVKSTKIEGVWVGLEDSLLRGEFCMWKCIILERNLKYAVCVTLLARLSIIRA